MTLPPEAPASGWSPPSWVRWIPPCRWGLEVAADDDEAFRTFVLNTYGLSVVIVSAGLGLYMAVTAQWGEVVGRSFGIATGLTILLLDRAGRLAWGRRFMLAAGLLVAPPLLAIGGARTGLGPFVPALALGPALLVEVERRSIHLVYGVALGLLAGLGAYIGLSSPLYDLASTHRPVNSAVLLGATCIAVSILSMVSLRRHAHFRDRLEDALSAAHAAQRTREALLSAVSHELRTPASMALGLLDEMETATGVDAKAQLGRDARALVAKEIELLDDLIDVVSLRRGTLPSRPRPTSLALVVSRAIREAAIMATDRGFELVVRLDPKLGERVVDPARVGQVLRHLTSNAVKFSHGGPVRVSMHGEPEHLRMVVEDRGPGLPADRIEQLEQPLQQGDMGLGRQHSGMGLGLTLVRAITQSMGAEVEVCSKPGKGTCFSIRIPAPPAGEPTQSLSDLTGWSVLVVDDLPLNRKILARLVQRLGVTEVSEACDGADAVRAWAEHRPDLVLMDMQMPGVDGPEAARRIRARGGQTLILAVTANVTPAAEVACMEAGMDGYLTKPLQAEALLRSVSLCGGAPQPRRARRTETGES